MMSYEWIGECYRIGGAALIAAALIRVIVTIHNLTRAHNLPATRAHYRDLEIEDEWDERTRWN